jgi:hypothetical protein
MPTTTPVRTILLWHVHGSWTESFVSGSHRYLLPLTPDGDANGRGLCGRNWPRAREIPVDRLADEQIDVLVFQRPEELELAAQWLGWRTGSDVPAVYVEHNAPRPSPTESRHLVADRSDITLVHVTDFNRLMWDNGMAPTTVVAHGIPDPGELYTGEVAAAATMINEPLRRGRVVGTDLLEPLSKLVPLEVWGMGTLELNGRIGGQVTGRGDLSAPVLHREIARRRVYVHTARWTSLGLSLLEAMHLGMPVVAVATTMAPLIVPREAGVVSADIDALVDAVEMFAHEPEAASAAGKSARQFALRHFGLDRFLEDWSRLIDELCA